MPRVSLVLAVAGPALLAAACGRSPDECVATCPAGTYCFSGACVPDYDAGEIRDGEAPDEPPREDGGADADGDVETGGEAEGGAEGDAGDEAEGGEAEDGDAAEDGPADDGGCGAATDPLALWRERPELDLIGSGPLTRLGTIDGPCVVDGYRVVVSRDMRVRFEANTGATERLTVRLAFYDSSAFSGPPATPLVDDVGAPGYTAILEWTIPRSGEYLLLVHDLELEDPGSYALNASCIDHCGGKATRFPIVFLHGFGGWDTVLGFLDYFHQVKGELEGLGYAAYTPVADAINDTPTRALQFAAQIDEVFAETRARKVNLVGHSQGGLDGRYLISTLGYGDRVGVLAMVSTPNQGTLVADALTGEMPVAGGVLSALFDTWGLVLGGSEADTRDAFGDLTTTHVRTEFNPGNPDDARVRYWSYAGSSCGTLDVECRAASGGESVDPLLIASYEFLLGEEPDHGPNDGLVVVASATYGRFLGTIPADHWDEIGQLADSGPRGPFDHLAFYAGLAERLHDEGY